MKRYAHPELATTAKVAVNLLLLSGIATVVESITFGRADGLTDEKQHDLLDSSPMVAPGLRNRLQGVFDASGSGWWSTVLAAKDADLTVGTAAGSDKALRLAPTFRDLYRAAAEASYDHDDMVAVVRLYR